MERYFPSRLIGTFDIVSSFWFSLRNDQLCVNNYEAHCISKLDQRLNRHSLRNVGYLSLSFIKNLLILALQYPLHFRLYFPTGVWLVLVICTKAKQNMSTNTNIFITWRGADSSLSNHQTLVITCDWPATRFNRILVFLTSGEMQFETSVRWR